MRVPVPIYPSIHLGVPVVNWSLVLSLAAALLAILTRLLKYKKRPGAIKKHQRRKINQRVHLSVPCKINT